MLKHLKVMIQLSKKYKVNILLLINADNTSGLYVISSLSYSYNDHYLRDQAIELAYTWSALPGGGKGFFKMGVGGGKAKFKLMGGGGKPFFKVEFCRHTTIYHRSCTTPQPSSLFPFFFSSFGSLS